MLKKIYIGLLVLLIIGATYFFIYVASIISALGGFDKDYSVTELKENFSKNKTDIYELKGYFNKIVPKNKIVDIEFDDDETLSRLGIKSLDTLTNAPKDYMFLQWNLKINTKRVESILKSLGWNRTTLKILKEKLDKVDCIEIESGEPAKIGFKRCGMGMYFFNVFDKPIPNNLRTHYNDGCTYILVNDKLVLEYGGGGFGNQCFYDKD